MRSIRERGGRKGETDHNSKQKRKGTPLQRTAIFTSQNRVIFLSKKWKLVVNPNQMYLKLETGTLLGTTNKCLEQKLSISNTREKV